MKLGFFSIGLSPMSPDEIIRWGAQAGFASVELGCWPLEAKRGFNGTQLDVTQITRERAMELLTLSKQRRLSITCLNYSDNNLAHDPAQQNANLNHLLRVIEVANWLAVDTVCTFIGRDETKTINENITLAGQVFRPILDYAKSKNVRVCVENCPMPGWQQEGMLGNVAHSPDVWDRLFQVLPDDNFGLNFDPAHAYWLDIDPARAAREYGHKIFDAHAKDLEIVREQRYRKSILDTVNNVWRIARVPGRGEIDMVAFIQGLRAGGYDGALNIELEDPDWLGSPERVQAGMVASLNYLQPLMQN